MDTLRARDAIEISPLPHTEWKWVYRAKNGKSVKAVKCRELFVTRDLGPCYNKKITLLWSVITGRDKIPCELLDVSVRQVAKNESPSVDIPPGCIITILTLEQCNSFFQGRRDATTKCTMINGGIPTATMVRGGVPGREVVFVVANIAISHDTALFFSEDLDTIFHMELGCRIVTESSICHDYMRHVMPTGSRDINCRFELTAGGFINPCCTVCMDAFVPFNIDTELDDIWVASSAYYKMEEDGVEFRPLLMNKCTGEVCSALWYSNDAILPTSANCDMADMTESHYWSEVLRNIPCEINLSPHLQMFPELFNAMSALLDRDVIAFQKLTNGWKYYKLTTKTYISPNDPIRFPYGIYSKEDNADTSYRKDGLPMNTQMQLAICFDHFPLEDEEDLYIVVGYTKSVTSDPDEEETACFTCQHTHKHRKSTKATFEITQPIKYMLKNNAVVL